MEKKNIVRIKSYRAMFKLEVVDFVKEKGYVNDLEFFRFSLHNAHRRVFHLLNVFV
jgi:hypothetical protein